MKRPRPGHPPHPRFLPCLAAVLAALLLLALALPSTALTGRRPAGSDEGRTVETLPPLPATPVEGAVPGVTSGTTGAQPGATAAPANPGAQAAPAAPGSAAATTGKPSRPAAQSLVPALLVALPVLAIVALLVGYLVRGLKKA